MLFQLKRKLKANKEINTLFLYVIAFLVFSISIGYSALNQNLMISGDVNYYAMSSKLYDVLKSASQEGAYATKYTGSHQDSWAGDGIEDIYYWYATSDAGGTRILDKNNVIFAGQCWQMIRTTDTGGVKMIYNGEAENDQCLNTRGTHIGYGSRTSQNLASNYYYGTSYEYDSTNNVFTLSGTLTQETWNATTGPTLIGKYTCKSASETGTCATIYLIESYYTETYAHTFPISKNSHYSQFGTLAYNYNNSSPAYVGYMYNTVYPYKSKIMVSSETVLSSSYLATTYWYAHDAIWGSPTADRYNLDSPYQVSATTDYPNLVGEYTFRKTIQTYTDTSVYYIAAVNGAGMYYIQLSNSGNHTLSDFNYTYTYGDSFTDNGDGTYTINNPTTINRSDWYTNYSNVGANKYVCKNAVNDTCSELWYTTATSTTSMTYINVANNYKYAKGFTWDGSKYVLDNDTSTSFWNINDSTNKTSINNAHYTCWNEMGECTTISYIYFIRGTTLYYINITNGKTVEDAKNEMLYDDNVNTTNSMIKSGVDAWYKHYLSDYSGYLEDTIFCNDRSQINQSNNGWNPNGGSTSTYMFFYGASDLSCPNDTDKFSVSNNKAKLTYKVGLMSYREMNLLNRNTARVTGQDYWLASPYSFNDIIAYELNVSSGGGMSNSKPTQAYGVRPAVSLQPRTEYITGDGSMASPYIVDAPPVVEPEDFATDSWETIVMAAKTGNTSAYQVGDTKEVDMGELGTHTLRIANKSTPSECSTTGFSQTACGFVLEFADIITTHNMNSANTNVGGWPASAMRTYLNDTNNSTSIINSLPEVIRNEIIDTTVVSGHGSTTGETNFTSTDKLYLLSAHEIFDDVDGNTSSGIDYTDTAYDNTRQLDYYANLGVTTSSYSGAIKQSNGSNSNWWLRSANCSNTSGSNGFHNVNGSGNWFGNSALNTSGVSPAFRIG